LSILPGVKILGARSVLALAKSRSDGLSSWALALQQRRGYWKAVVAIASKNARLAWALLHRGEAFRMPA
jgi:transposase